MQVTKIITNYGVIKNPSTIETKMVLINPHNAKTLVEKPLERFCQKVAQDEELRSKLYTIYRGQYLPLNKALLQTNFNTTNYQKKYATFSELLNT